MKTIIVTGGAGYIGSHTIIELIENTNYRIVSIDNFSNSYESTLDRIEEITGVRIHNYNIDLCDKEAINNVFEIEKNVIGIIHFAAFKSVPESVDNPYKYFHNNFESLLNILEVSLANQVNHFIFSSSCSVYGNINKLPVNEDTTLNKAESPYAYTKQVGEEILKTYTNKFSNLNVVALRYFNPVGAHSSGLNGELPLNKPTSLVPVITQTAIGINKQMAVFGADYATRDGSCIRDYIHVTDIALAHIKALEYSISKKNTCNYAVINLGSGKGVSVFEAITAFENATGEKLKFVVHPKREGDVEAIFSDTTKSEKELNWKATKTIEEMMLSAWKWEQNLKK
ncbi:MAG: UDP-glucose 4-epimerase GalE [Flavobacteriia bacterium]|nr:UDP-glucose 4-epimerase GalE [Flavobacteriia bacterium]